MAFSFSTPATQNPLTTSAPTLNTGFSFANPTTSATNPIVNPAAGLGNAAGVMTPAQMVQNFNQITDPNGPYFPWRFVFYNKVDPKQIGQYTRPAKMSEDLWRQAIELNPDPTCMVPVLAEDFTGLHDRMKHQNEQKKKHEKSLQEIKEYAEKMEQNHIVSTMVKIEKFKMEQMELTSRIVHLMIRLEVLRTRGQSLTREEELFRTKLENIQKELNQPNQYKSTVNELSSKVQMSQESGRIAYPTLDDEDIKKLQEILIPQGRGLRALVEVLKKDTEDIHLMLERYQKARDAMLKS